MKKAISLSASILFLMAAIMMFLIPFSGLAETDDPDAAAHEAQIMANAKRLYDQVIKEHGSAAGYVNYIAQLERYYRVTMNEAQYYNKAYDTSVSFCTTLAKVGVSVISKSPSDALVSVGKTYYNQFLKEISKGLPKISKAEFVYGQATAGIEEIRTADLWDIMDRVAANGGEFVSAEDAVNFIVGYQNNRACFVSAELGRAYYYDQLNQGPWDTLGEIGVNVFISEVSKKICPYETYWEVDYLKGYAVTQVKNYIELIVTQLENPHITQWKEDLEAIEAETEKMLSYIPTAGSPYLPTLPVHTVTYDPNGGRVGVSQHIAYEGEAYGYMPTPFWFGYEFLGWFDAPEGGTAYTASSIYSLSSDQTLYAHWGRSILSQGSCGEHLIYVLYGDGLLEIDGYGKMTSIPWIDQGYADRIGEVQLPEGLSSIAPRAFSYCAYLFEISIPDSVKEIEREAFRYSRLKELHIPYGVEEIGYSILEGNTFIKEIVVPGSVKYMRNCGSIDYDGVFSGSGVERAVLEAGITSIDDCTFSHASKLSEVVIPDTVTKIGTRAFYECSSLEHIDLPDSVRTIYYEAFAYSGLRNLQLPDNIHGISGDILYGNNYIKVLKIPKSLVDGSFITRGSSVEKVIFEDGTTTIRSFVEDGYCLKEVVIPSTVTRINRYAFKNTSLKEIKLPDNIKYLGYDLLEGNTGVKEITIPASVEYIEGDTHLERGLLVGSSVEKVVFESGIEEIESCVCFGVSSLREVTIPDTVVSIDSCAFMKSGITSVVIPNSVREIGRSAFNACDNLTDVYFDGSYSDWLDISIAEYNYRLETATIHFSNNPPADFVLPDGLSTIEEEAFSGCCFTFVDISENVKNVEAKAFAGCQNLKMVHIPNNVEMIAEDAFLDCPNLSTIIGEKGSYAESFASNLGYSFIVECID